MANRLAEMYALGQSPWNDNVARDQIKAGHYQDLIENFSIVGVTSNPSIFAKAMTAGNAYDDQFRQLAGQGLDANSIYEAMAIQDISDVLDIFRPVYDRTKAEDGYVSLEVSPLLAYDTDKTIADAKRLFGQIGKPNLFIKIPATNEGIPAIEAAIADGINVNVTLIFGLDYYERVIEAYISGLEKLAASGKKPLSQVASVASFFVSRVDTLLDPMLDEKAKAGNAQAEGLKGKAAIANARLAYELYKSYFVEGPKAERFKKLQAQGAQVQRPLWASTSTKNPAYRDVLYVEELIGPNTVDTMPPATITAFADHGNAVLTVEHDIAGAHKLFDDLKAVGVDFKAVTDKLILDGAALFKKDFEGLLTSIDEKRKKLAAEEGNHAAANSAGTATSGSPAAPEAQATTASTAPTPAASATPQSAQPTQDSDDADITVTEVVVSGLDEAGDPVIEDITVTEGMGVTVTEIETTHIDAFGNVDVDDVVLVETDDDADDTAGGNATHRTDHLPVADSAAIDATVSDLLKKDFVNRVWKYDGSAWKSDPKVRKEIEDRLGWIPVLNEMKTAAPDLKAFADELRGQGYTHALLLGMGGSSLGPEVFNKTFGTADGYLHLGVIDTTDPAAIMAFEQAAGDLAKTVFIVSSKSGSTVEPNAFYAYFWDKVKAVKGDKVHENFIAITDPGTHMDQEATSKGFRRIFRNRADIGGRYSVLSYFGLVPAALMGIDVAKLVDRALAMADNCDENSAVNPGLRLGATMGTLAKRGRDKATIIASDGISSYGLWAEQLIAESTGKEGRGVVPVAGEDVGQPGNYSADRFFISLDLAGDIDDATQTKLDALAAADNPVVHLALSDKYDIAAEFFRWEFAIATVGAVLDIDPFDQPNVQESKDNTVRLTEGYKKEGKLPLNPPTLQADGLSLFAPGGIGSGAADAAPAANLSDALASFVTQARPGTDYVAIMAYVTPSERTDEQLSTLRLLIRNYAKVATTVGYGPRFLHSTGQLHKGGANNGVFLQIVADDPDDAPVPGMGFSFSILKQAQALGDLQSLQSHGRRVVSVNVGSDPVQGLEKLVGVMQQALGLGMGAGKSSLA